MESIGQILKTARERRQMSVSDVAAVTKMKITFVEAIEADNLSVFVAPVYARGFIKLYAESVCVDHLYLLKQINLSEARAQPPLAVHKVLAPPKAARAHAEMINPESESESAGIRPKEGAAQSTAALHAEAPARAPISRPPLSRPAPLPAGRWPTPDWTFITRARWPWFKKRNFAFLQIKLPLVVWRQVFMLAGLALLIIAAALAWEWSNRVMPSMTDACRWAADPPAPYLTMEIRAAPSMKTPNIQHPTSNVE